MLRIIEPLVYFRQADLPDFQYHALEDSQGKIPVGIKVAGNSWEEIKAGAYWGAPRTNFILRTSFKVPLEWGKDILTALFLPIGIAGDFSHPEALCIIDGQIQAACDRNHQEISLSGDWCDGKEHQIALHGWTGGIYSRPEDQLQMRQCQLVQIHQETRDFICLARIALETAALLAETDPAKSSLYNVLDKAFHVLDTRYPLGDNFYQTVSTALKVLEEGVTCSGKELPVQITAVGHAHLDLAWLWTIGQTRRKAARTFSNVLQLMKEYPQFSFTQSQPQIYEWVKQDYPDIFKEVSHRVEEGRWELIGGMWVEADCNLAGAEALARQFLLGRHYFEGTFGKNVETSVLWLPDVFGFSWNLPQLMREAGIKYFFTTKLSWNQYNRIPYDTFWWQGLDGTRVLTHFGTTKENLDTHHSIFNARVSPEQVMSTWKNFQQKDGGKAGCTLPLLMAFGYGDGGGGPNWEMLENIRLLEAFPSMPQVKVGTVKEFFSKLEDAIGEKLPVWNNELYLEFHRGVYTTHARIKRANRKSEFLLHDVEFLASFAGTIDAEFDYPQESLREAWKLLCTNQFHDILPGSSIAEVYVESLHQYEEIYQICRKVREKALKTIAKKSEGDIFVINPTSFTRNDFAFLTSDEKKPPLLKTVDGIPIRSQVVDGGWLLDLGESAPYSIAALSLTSKNETLDYSGCTLIIQKDLLENDFLRILLNENGDIVRIFDKVHEREVIPPGAIFNQIQAFEDRPRSPDAWDIDIYYNDKMWLAEPAESIQVIERGPLRISLEIKRKILTSEITQRISLVYNQPRISFDTSIMWRERSILLKTAFPVEVHSPRATYEIQWGNIERSTHHNTSWDWARFEVCAQKWVDLSEGGYGVSLINDCKYGHDIRDNVIRLSLLRGTINPDPGADLGEHQFSYAIYPHPGSWDEHTVREAYILNDPLYVWQAKDIRNSQKDVDGTFLKSSFVSVEQSNVIIETIKQAEDGRGLILRLNEFKRMRGTITLKIGFPLKEVWRTNILEENQDLIHHAQDNSFRFSIKPFQILTFRLVPKRKEEM